MPVDLRIDGGTAIALMFHDHEWEQMALLKALDTDAFYVGALGSWRAHARRVEGLVASGCSDEGIARIKAPIGLVHRLRDPHLIAASVIAEIAAAFRRTELGVIFLPSSVVRGRRALRRSRWGRPRARCPNFVAEDAREDASLSKPSSV